MTPRAFVSRIGFSVIAALLGVGFALPLIWFLFAPFNARAELGLAIPNPFTFANFMATFQNSLAMRALLNSLIQGVGGVILIGIAATLAAYALSRSAIPGKNGVNYVLLLFSSVVSGSAAMVPIFLIISGLGLIDTHLAVILVFSGGLLPTAMFILRDFIEGIPRTYEESAMVAGAGPLRAFFDVALPVIRPGIVVVVVWAFVNIWGSFLIPFILLRSDELLPASVAIYSFYSEAGTTPTSGGIRIGGTDVTSLHPKDRQISMVFQDYALYPHMNIYENIAYPLKVRGEPVEKRRARAREVADVLKIGNLLDRLPGQISGGQQQRTSLARALVYPSRVYLFDEPLSNLDAKLRLEARGFLNHLQRDMGMTAVYVTHDQAEAMALATRIAVMNQGRIVQYASPIEIYRRPATTFVASFVGNPPMNLVPVEAMIADGALRLRANGFAVAAMPVSDAIGKTVAANPHLTLGVRPEHLRLAGSAEVNTIHGKLFANENMGPESLVTLERGDGSRVTARLFTDDHVEVTEDVSVAFDASHATLFDATGMLIPGPNEREA